MKTFLSESKKAIMLAIGLLLACFLLIVFSVDGGVVAWAVDSDTQEHEEKIFCNATIEDDFDPSCVIVVMDKHTGGINKRHEDSFFGNFKTLRDYFCLELLTGFAPQALLAITPGRSKHPQDACFILPFDSQTY